MAGRAYWIGRVVRDFDVDLTAWDTPRGEGEAFDRIRAVVIHDTVTTEEWEVERVCELVEDGRDDLSGPLYNIGVDRAPEAHWIADGSANHNGYGEFGNDSIGIAFYVAGALDGRQEPASEDQQDVAARVCAAICLYVGLSADRVLGHKETDPDRKPDPFGVDMDAFRGRVREYMRQGAPTVMQGDDMADVVKFEDDGKLYVWHPKSGNMVHLSGSAYKAINKVQDGDNDIEVKSLGEVPGLAQAGVFQ